jgi:ABC-type histidine transport system ATPase subunit
VRSVEGPSAIAVTELRKSFGDVEPVRGVSFEVGAGEVFKLPCAQRRRQDDDDQTPG